MTIQHDLAQMRAEIAKTRPGYRDPNASRRVTARGHVASAGESQAGRTIAVDDPASLPCVFRGPRVGYLDCPCPRQPVLYDCQCAAVKMEFCSCVIRRPRGQPKATVLDRGETLPIDGPVEDHHAVCIACKYRLTPPR